MTATMKEDVVLAALLKALEDLHNIRNEMHTCLKQASLNCTVEGAVWVVREQNN